MAMNTFGDMARAYALRHQNTLLKKDIHNLNQELSTGKASDLASHLGGSFSRLTGIERDMRRLEGFRVTLSEADQLTGIMQERLGQINELSGGFARNLLLGGAIKTPASTEALVAEGRMHFSTIVSMLNSEIAGRKLFSGDTTDVSPLIDGESLLAELETVVAGAVTAADIATALDTWFASPVGFDSFAYQGSTTPMAPLKLSETASVPLNIRADDQALKDTLKGIAMAAMALAPGTSLSSDNQYTLFRDASLALLGAETAVISLQAKLGTAQEQIEKWSVRNQSEKFGLDHAKSALLAIDPFEAATHLEAAQFQLESLYAVTVRLSKLSLVNFLR